MNPTLLFIGKTLFDFNFSSIKDFTNTLESLFLVFFLTFGSSTIIKTTPSLSFTGDSNTGIYSPGSNILSFATNGVERFRLSSGAASDFTFKSKIILLAVVPVL